MITFQNKVALNENPDIPEVNKITDDNIQDYLIKRTKKFFFYNKC